jgi:hypothetical protein
MKTCLLKASKFSHEGRGFEVRAVQLDNEIKVQLFEGEKPASSVVYSVPIETAFDGQPRGFPLENVDRLMQRVEEETKAGRLQLHPKGGA